jgi:hypothetical protein
MPITYLHMLEGFILIDESENALVYNWLFELLIFILLFKLYTTKLYSRLIK